MQVNELGIPSAFNVKKYYVFKEKYDKLHSYECVINNLIYLLISDGRSNSRL